MTALKYITTAMIALILLAGCDQGPMEETGEDIDEAVEETGEQVEDAGEETGEQFDEAQEEFE